jgi:hypothetical protein
MAGYLFSSQASSATLLQPATSASVAWKSEPLMPSTSVTLHEPSSVVAVGDALDTLSLAALANKVFVGSRAMEDWEKRATDDFYLSHFR